MKYIDQQMCVFVSRYYSINNHGLKLLNIFSGELIFSATTFIHKVNSFLCQMAATFVFDNFIINFL